jgi:UDP-glucose 4-epimerase
MKTVLITGGAGFIGSHTVDKFLSKNFKVRVLDNLIGGREQNLQHHSKNKNLEVEIKDIRKINKSWSFLKSVDYVVHFAGIGDIVPSIENPKKYISNNFDGTLNLLNCVRDKPIKKLVYAASSSCYGLAKTPTNEKHSIDLQHPYALSKYLGEQACLNYANCFKLPVNSIRIFNAYGIRSKTSGAYGAVFGVFLKQLLSNKPLTVVGNGNQSRDFVYVTDVADAFYKATLTKKNKEIWNLGSAKPIKINYLVSLLKPKKIIRIPDRPGEPKMTYANNKKIIQDLSWKPVVNFDSGVKKMLKNIDYWKDAPLWTEDKIKKATRKWFENLS